MVHTHRRTTATERKPPQDGMMKVALEVEGHHTAPAPMAAPAAPELFNRYVIYTLLAGVILGALLGCVLGVMHWTGVLVIAGTEQLFSAGGPAVVMFWGAIGMVCGVAAAGVAVYFLPPRTWMKSEK